LAGKLNPIMQLLVKTINKHKAVDKSVRLIILARIIPCNLRLTHRVTLTSTTRLYRGYVNYG
jgi:hypothetical protein